MVELEQTLTAVEEAAVATVAAARGLTAVTRKMQKAARTGNIANLKRGPSALDASLQVLQRAVEALNQQTAEAEEWPSRTDEGEQSFEDCYSSELRSAASVKGLNVSELDGQLISFPSILRVDDRAVVIDQKKVPDIRPSHIVRTLVENQRKLDRFKPERILESMYSVYQVLAKEYPTPLPTGDGPLVPLAKIYRQLTLLPGTSREYTKADFSRDLYLLEYKDIRRTKKGVEVSLIGSTGTRQSGYFSFVSHDGHEAKYYGIRFRNRA